MTFWTDTLTVPHELRFVDAAGIKTRSLIAGQGQPVIFLHGITGHLEAFIPVLAAHAQRFQVHLIDMLGHGYTDKPEGPYTIERLARHVLDYMDALGIQQAHLVGISQGGWTAAYLAAKFPDRVQRVTLIVAAGNPHMDRMIVQKFLYEATREAVYEEDREKTRARLAAVVADPASLTEELIDVRYGIYHTPEFRAHLEDILASALPENYDRDALTPELLAEIKAEALVVWGEDDPSGRAGSDYLMPHLAHGRLLVFKDAGHWVPFERPADFSAVSVAFLEGGLAATPETVN